MKFRFKIRFEDFVLAKLCSQLLRMYLRQYCRDQQKVLRQIGNCIQYDISVFKVLTEFPVHIVLSLRKKQHCHAFTTERKIWVLIVNKFKNHCFLHDLGSDSCSLCRQVITRLWCKIIVPVMPLYRRWCFLTGVTDIM